MNKVWAIVAEHDYESSETLEVFGDEDSANEMLRLINESKADRLTDDRLVKCPFGADSYHVEEWEVSHDDPAELVQRLKNEQWVHVERMREIYSSPRYIEAQRLAQEHAEKYRNGETW